LDFHFLLEMAYFRHGGTGSSCALALVFSPPFESFQHPISLSLYCNPEPANPHLITSSFFFFLQSVTKVHFFPSFSRYEQLFPATAQGSPSSLLWNKISLALYLLFPPPSLF